jgi:hypothetical protein
MSRLMSVAMTEQPVVDRTKTVTRRLNWWRDKNGRRLLKRGDRLTLCRKVQGRKPDELIVRLAEVQVTGIRRERLDSLTDREVKLEGFPGMSPGEFIERFFKPQGIGRAHTVTRIEWRYIEGDQP